MSRNKDILFLSLLIFTCCMREDTSGIRRIEYGTSFGECIGYCKHDISITSDKVVFTKSGWPDTLAPGSCTSGISARDFSALTGKISLPDFEKLAAVIGCPDCADGGAEWIRIVSSDSDKKVTFEYGNEPDAVKGYIGILRDYQKGFDNCK